MNYRELNLKLRPLGCEFGRHAKGDYEVWVRRVPRVRTTVPNWDNQDLTPGTISGILGDLQISRDDFEKDWALSVKCVICHGEEIVDASVFEEIAVGADIVRIPVTVLACQTCGERYSMIAIRYALGRRSYESCRSAKGTCS